MAETNDIRKMKIDVGELQKKKLFVATPMYGGACAGMFTKSIAELTRMAGMYNIHVHLYFMFNESLIPRARNYCVDEFLRSDCTHLMFIDADIGFNPKDVLLLMQLADSSKEMDIVCGPYTKKTIAWEKIKKAVDMGFADQNPFQLEQFVGDYVFNTVSGQAKVPLHETVEVLESGTGFMMITREALEKYAAAYPELKYLPDHNRTEHFDGTREITAFFDTVIDPETKRYLSEDYMFCQYARRAGIKVWLCPWMQMKHVGSYVFGGTLGAMAAIQASPTASAESNQKHYKKKKDRRNRGNKGRR